MIVDRKFILSIVLWLARTEFTAAFINDTWPPQIIIDTFDMVGFSEKCLKETSVDIRKLDEFTFQHDLTKLPDDRSLKCYMACIFTQYTFLLPGNPRLQLQALFNIFPAMTDDERSHFLKLASGCTKLRAKDHCDAVYIANVCMKQNSNDYYYIPYNVEYWSNRKKNGKYWLVKAQRGSNVLRNTTYPKIMCEKRTADITKENRNTETPLPVQFCIKLPLNCFKLLLLSDITCCW